MVNETKLQSPYGQLDDCLKITNEQSTEVVYNFGDILELDREYTFSCWFRADSEIQISIQISNERSRYFPVTSEWQKVSFTASANTATSKKVFFTIPANNTLYAYEGMLELGNIASDFKPSEKDIENVVTTLQTNFTVQQGKIESLIKETTIDNGDGTTTSLKDAYNQTKQTVEGNKTTIANVQTKVNDLTGDVESIKSNITEIEQTAEGLKTTVSKASSDASNALKTANTANSTADAAKTTATNAQTIAQQTASKFSWIVKSGSSATDFTLTDRTASLVANYINLNGKVTFSGLDSSAQSKINTAQSTADSANSKIDNLEIGGRNLLYKSSMIDEQLLCYDIIGMNDVTLNKYEKEGFHLITPSTGNKNNGVGFHFTDFTTLAQSGDTIIFSFDVKGSSDNNKPFTNILMSANADSWWLGIASNNIFFVPTNAFQRVSVTFTIPANANTFKNHDIFLAIHGNFQSDLYIKNLKLEKGNKPTDWTPAPEDKANQSIIDNWAKDSIVGGETTINGGYIKTNTIKTDQLAVDDIFATGSAAMNIINAQEINANRITSGQLSAERINVYGLSVLNKDNNQQTFNIANNGEVTIKGSVSSSNYNIGKTGWSINNDGTAEFNDIIARGSVITNDGGIVSSGGTGRNLLLDSSTFSGWHRTSNQFTPTSENGVTVVSSSNTGQTSNIIYSIYSKPLDYSVIQDKYFTFSVEMKVDDYAEWDLQIPFIYEYYNSNDTRIGWEEIGIENNLLTIVGDKTNGNWVKLIFTRKGTNSNMTFESGTNISNVATFGFRLTLFRNGSIHFRKPKLEIGTVSTDYSIAPEDKIKQVRFWAGSSYEDRESAPFIVYNDGSIRATQGEYSGLWTGDIKIGNISIVDPSSQSGNDALVTIQNGANGIKRVQLTDNTSSCFAQDIIITNNTYSPMISLKQDGSAYYSKGINIADKTTLNSTSLIINNKTLTTTSNGSGFLFNNELNVGTANQSANLIVHGNVSTDNITVDSTLYFGDVLKFTKNANGINIDFI